MSKEEQQCAEDELQAHREIVRLLQKELDVMSRNVQSRWNVRRLISRVEGPGQFQISYQHSSLEDQKSISFNYGLKVQDPGKWNFKGPGSVIDELIPQ